MAKVFPIFSSSKGNCTYIGDSTGGLLVDAGASCKRICEALCEKGISLSKIGAILITHDHSDHISGLRVLLKKTGALVIASRDTVYSLEFHKIIDDNTKRIYIDELPEYKIGTLSVKRFPTSHDSLGSGGYIVTLSDGKRVAVCTDLGIVTDDIRESLSGVDLAMIESNHDPVMLRLGPYPPELKLRVGGEKGHLSNAVSSELVGYLFKTGTRRFILAHLSEKNNTPEKAESSARASLMNVGARSDDYILYVAKPDCNKVITL